MRGCPASSTGRSASLPRCQQWLRLLFRARPPTHIRESGSGHVRIDFDRLQHDPYAATPGDADKPAKATTIAYREALTRLWLLDPISGWIPEGNLLTRLAQAPKHHLADPALAARLLGATANGLLRNTVVDRGSCEASEGLWSVVWVDL